MSASNPFVKKLGRDNINDPVRYKYTHYLMETYSLSHKLTLPDALIAATALVHTLELYTLNAKDFRFIADIQLYQPVSY